MCFVLLCGCVVLRSSVCSGRTAGGGKESLAPSLGASGASPCAHPPRRHSTFSSAAASASARSARSASCCVRAPASAASARADAAAAASRRCLSAAQAACHAPRRSSRLWLVFCVRRRYGSLREGQNMRHAQTNLQAIWTAKTIQPWCTLLLSAYTHLDSGTQHTNREIETPSQEHHRHRTAPRAPPRAAGSAPPASPGRGTPGSCASRVTCPGDVSGGWVCDELR